MATLRHEAIYREIIHPLLAALTPIVGLLAFASLVEDLFALNVLTPLMVLALLSAAVVEVVTGNIVRAHRGGWHARLREFLLVCAAAYLLFALLGGAGTPGTPSTPGAASEAGAGTPWTGARLIVQVLLVAACWFGVNRRHEAFRPRENFLESVRGQSGQVLRHTMRNTRGFATDILVRLRDTNYSAALGFFGLLAASAVVWASDQQMSGRSFALIAAYGPTMVLSAATVNAFAGEFAVYGEGIRVPNRYLRRLVTAGGIFALGAFLLSLTFARDTSVFSPAALAGALEGLNDWLSARPVPRPSPPADTGPSFMEELLREYSVSPQDLEASRFWELFARVFRAVARTLVFLLAVAFVFYPFFLKRFRRTLTEERPLRRLLAYLSGVLALLIGAGQVLIAAVRGAVVGLLERARGARAATGAGREAGRPSAAGGSSQRPRPGALTRRRRTLVRRMLEEIAEEGKKKGVPKSRSSTAREYSHTLNHYYPDLDRPLATLTPIAERALYAPDHPSRGELRSFTSAGRSVLQALRHEDAGAAGERES